MVNARMSTTVNANGSRRPTPANLPIPIQRRNGANASATAPRAMIPYSRINTLSCGHSDRAVPMIIAATIRPTTPTRSTEPIRYERIW